MTNIYEISRESTLSKVKAEAKANITEALIKALKEIYGEDEVKMVRTGNTSKTNEIGVVIGLIDKDGETVNLCATVSSSIKEPFDRKTDKKSYIAFDIEEAAEAYNSYIEDKAIKTSTAEKRKAEKIKADEARRISKAKETEENIDDGITPF